jgi:hypothetical protein
MPRSITTALVAGLLLAAAPAPKTDAERDVAAGLLGARGQVVRCRGRAFVGVRQGHRHAKVLLGAFG